MRLPMSPVLAGQLAAAVRIVPIDFRGRGWIASSLQKLTRLQDPSAWSFKMRRGHVMVAPPTSSLTWGAAFTGRYDDAEIEMLASLARRPSLVLDVGASFGFYSIPLALATRDFGCHTIAVEPIPSNLEILRQNVDQMTFVPTSRCSLMRWMLNACLLWQPSRQGERGMLRLATPGKTVALGET